MKILRRVLFGLPLSASAAPAQIIPNRRLDDLVSRVTKLEERVAQQAERIARLEERTREQCH